MPAAVLRIDDRRAGHDRHVECQPRARQDERGGEDRDQHRRDRQRRHIEKSHGVIPLWSKRISPVRMAIRRQTVAKRRRDSAITVTDFTAVRWLHGMPLPWLVHLWS
jgi:hypothetical protein